MIYCFKGCGEACKCCGKACEEFGRCCNEVCGPCCKVLERPLGGYVLLTAIVNFLVLVCAGIGLADKDVPDCDQPVLAMCGGNVVLAILHAGFAIYLQQRLVAGMASDRSMDLQSRDLMKRAGEIVLYDVGFCIYIFIFIGSFGLNCVGIAWVSDCSLETPMPMVSAALLLLYAFGVGFFMVLWYCALACDTCMGDTFKPRPAAATGGRPRQRRGLLAFLLGGLFDSGSQSARQRPPATSMGAPVAQGYVVSPPAAHPGPHSVPPCTTQTQPQPSAASQIAAGGLQLAGQGLQAAAGWFGGKKRRRKKVKFR
jgi:hypothetical protein